MITCANCGQRNPTHALYCASCGLVLEAARRTASAGCCKSGAWTVLAGLAGLSIVSGVFTVAVSRDGRFDSPRVRVVQHEFDLDPILADAMFDLLAPSDIKVIVGRRDGGVFVRGTQREVDILRRFVSMLTEADGWEQPDAPVFSDQPTTSASARFNVRLPRSKARALVRVLQLAESPVGVSGSGNDVTLHATGADGETIQGVVDILRGRH